MTHPETHETEPRIPDDLSGCPYYMSGGTCIYGCWSEPACITDRPQGGWPSERNEDGPTPEQVQFARSWGYDL